MNLVKKFCEFLKGKKKILTFTNNNCFNIIWLIYKFKLSLCYSSIYLYSLLK